MDSNFTNETTKELKIDNNCKIFLSETAKWAKFLAILGYIYIGIVIFCILISMLIGGSSRMFGLLLIYIVVLLIYVIPIYYLHKFSSNMKNALLYQDQSKLTKSFEFMKSYYKFIGIMTIIAFSILFIIGIFAGSGAVAALSSIH